jgi:hypothetical protein
MLRATINRYHTASISEGNGPFAKSPSPLHEVSGRLYSFTFPI